MGSKDTIKQLNSAREIVLRDPAIYPQVVPGVLPVIGPSQPVELRRWGADFLAETFASPVVNAEEKGKMCLGVLDTLKAYLNRREEMGEEEDPSVLKGAIQCIASIYPLVFRHALGPAQDGAQEAWSKLMGLKSAILRRMDTAPAGVRICCIKFAARVVQVQTPGLISDPRKPEQNEISLALVSREHPFLNPSNLEAEASGLLDRLLSVLQDNISDALIVTSTLNALATLVQRRATISTKILTTVLTFNPARVTSTGKDRIAVKSMLRTTISFLKNFLNKAQTHALAPRIQAQIDRLRQIFADAFSEQTGLKRGPEEPVDGLPPNKRLQIDAQADSGTPPQRPSMDRTLPPGPVSYKDLFTLTQDQRAAGFHVGVLPAHIITQLTVALLQAADKPRFDQTLNTMYSRILEVERRPTQVGTDAPIGDDEDEEYDPGTLGFGETDQVSPKTGVVFEQPLEALTLPPEPPLSEHERAQFGEQARLRLFGTLRELDEEAARKRAEKKAITEKEKVNGFNRSIVTSTGSQEREGWITLMIRLATRSSCHLRDENGADGAVPIKNENDDRALAKKGRTQELAGRIRDALNKYIMDDWRRRIDVAIAWLNEEWYADRIASNPVSLHNSLPNFTPLTLTLLDQIIPYLDTKDGRYLIRFLSEIPSLPPEIFERVKRIAQDPERVGISAQTLLYLIMLRPPVRGAAVACAGEIWRENSDARAGMEKILVKWGPEILKEGKQEADVGAVKAEG